MDENDHEKVGESPQNYTGELVNDLNRRMNRFWFVFEIIVLAEHQTVSNFQLSNCWFAVMLKNWGRVENSQSLKVYK